MMQLIMENWREYKNRQYLLEDPAYVTATLGIQIPLNESYPYSSTLTEEILREQLLLEAFWDPVVAWGKAKAGETKDKVKDLAKSIGSWGQRLADTMYMLYEVLFEKGARLYNKSIKRTLLDPLKTPILKFLNLLIEKGAEWDILIFSKWAQKTKDIIVDTLDKVSNVAQQGWKGSLSITVIGLGLKKFWNKAGTKIQEILKLAADVKAGHTVKLIKEKITDLVDGVLVDLVKNTLKEVLKVASVAVGSVIEWVNKLKQMFGGLDFVVDGLSGVLKSYRHMIYVNKRSRREKGRWGDVYNRDDLPADNPTAYADNEPGQTVQTRMTAKQQKAT
jgi:hypothetical protein